jgi:SAM-dependent methyltransferase
VPRPCRAALEVGCGLGAFARRLARVADRVDALDREPEVLARARARSAAFGNLRFLEGDFLTWECAGPYDYVSFVASLHHLPFGEALSRASGLLRPGGVLAVLGLDRPASWLEAGAQAVVAWPVSGFHRLTRRGEPMDAPIAPPSMTWDEIRREAGGVLPGAALRRHLLWRYSLVWKKPAERPGNASPRPAAC